MRVLLVVGEVESLFQSGIVQQVFFTRESLLAAGAEVQVAVLGADEPAYRRLGVDAAPIHPDMPLGGIDVVLFVSTNPTASKPVNQRFLERARASGCRMALMLCGNHYYLLQEQFLFRRHGTERLRDGLFNPWLDEYWALETYAAQVPFLQALLGRPVRLLPYCWSPAVIDHHCTSRSLQPVNDGPRGAGLRVLIAEPNFSVHKSALVPLLIADGLLRRLAQAGTPQARVLLLGGRDLDHDLLRPFVALYARQVIEIYPRLNVMEVLAELRSKGHAVLLVSHHMSNSLNFLHLEALHLGYPVVHNSDPLAQTGFHYPGERVDAGIEAGWQALHEDAASRELRLARERQALARHAPDAVRVVHGYAQALARLGGAAGEA